MGADRHFINKDDYIIHFPIGCQFPTGNLLPITLILFTLQVGVKNLILFRPNNRWQRSAQTATIGWLLNVVLFYYMILLV